MPKHQPIIAEANPVALRIERAPRGGFYVTTPATDYGRIPDGVMFCSSNIDDALGFIKDQLEPETPAPEGIVSAVQWTEGEANALVRQSCPHCGIPEGNIVDDRCSGACTGSLKMKIEPNRHGDIFR